MLSKLFKHEFRSTARVQLPLMLAVVAATLILAILLLVNRSATEGTVLYTMTHILTTILGIFYVLGMLAYILTVHLLGIRRYYKNLFTDEGYLTLTLPVKNGYHQTVKLTAAVCWSIAGILVAGLCFLAFLYAGTDVSPAEFAQRVVALDLTGKAVGFMALIAITVLILEIYFFTFAYFCIAAGQTLSKKHKVAAAFVIYLIVQTILQIASLVLLSTGATIFEEALAQLFNTSSPITSFSIFLLIADVFSLALSGLFFGATNYLTHHRLNLE